MKHHISKLLILGLFLGLFASFSSCGDKAGSQKPTIVVGIPPQATLLKSIVGDSIDVVTLLKASSNPETFEPSVSDMRSVYNADAYFSIGSMPFEKALVDKILKSAPGVTFSDNSTGIDLIYGTHDHSHGEAHDCGDGHSHDAADPHTWSSVQNLKIVASNMLDAVVEIDPARKDFYERNYAALASRLDSIDAAYHSALDSLPQRAFLIWHPSLSYFARDYDLQQIAIGQENKEISVRQFKDNIDKAHAEDVDVFFIQKSYDASQAENLARQLDLQVVDIDPMNPDWEYELNRIVNAISGK